MPSLSKSYIILSSNQVDIGERTKQCDGCNNWFYQHSEIPPNPRIIHLTGSAELIKNCLPYTSNLCLIQCQTRFFKVCLADEIMFAVIALVCKKWRLFINEKFVEKVHYARLDREYDVQSWSKKLKEKFRKPLIIENCFHCNRCCNVEIEYQRTRTGFSFIQSDLKILENTYLLLVCTV